MQKNRSYLQWLLWLPPFLWAGVIYWISDQPKLPDTPSWAPENLDKLAHALVYAILSGCFYPGYRSVGFSRRVACWCSLISASVYGITDEWHQSFVPNRSADMWDWVADTTGAASVFVIAAWEHALFPAWLRKRWMTPDVEAPAP